MHAGLLHLVSLRPVTPPRPTLLSFPLSPLPCPHRLLHLSQWHLIPKSGQGSPSPPKHGCLLNVQCFSPPSIYIHGSAPISRSDVLWFAFPLLNDVSCILFSSLLFLCPGASRALVQVAWPCSGQLLRGHVLCVLISWAGTLVMVPGGAQRGLSCIRTPGALRPVTCSVAFPCCSAILPPGFCLGCVSTGAVSRHPGSLAVGSYLVLAPCQGGEGARGGEAQMWSLGSG